MSDNQEPQRKKVKFHLIKSPHFRTIHVDGAWGAITPTLDVQIVLYNERHPIPQQMVQIIDEEGRIGEEVVSERVIRDAMVRELETNVVMSEATAVALRDFLDVVLKKLATIRSATSGEGVTNDAS